MEFPPRPQGRPSNALKAQWLAVIEVLMTAGIERPSHMAQRTGLTFHTAKRWMQQVRKKWASQIDSKERAILGELLYRRASEVGEAAWKLAQTSNNHSVVIGALRTILESVDKRARIYGLHD